MYEESDNHMFSPEACAERYPCATYPLRDVRILDDLSVVGTVMIVASLNFPSMNFHNLQILNDRSVVGTVMISRSLNFPSRNFHQPTVELPIKEFLYTDL